MPDICKRSTVTRYVSSGNRARVNTFRSVVGATLSDSSRHGAPLNCYICWPINGMEGGM